MHHLFFVLCITFYVNMRTHIHFSPGATDADQPTNQQLWPHRFVLLLLLMLICVFHPHPGPQNAGGTETYCESRSTQT